MKANELRIGNRIYSYLDGFFESTKEEIVVDPVTMLMVDGVVDDRGIRFEPIPVTDEWLNRFGFDMRILKVFNQNDKVLEIEFDGTGNEIYQTEICTYQYIYVDGERECDKVNYLSINHIRFVHQLQNLYFALTGEEL